MSKWKQKRSWFRRAMAIGMSFALMVSYVPENRTQVQAATKETEILADSKQVNASDYELMGNVQGASILHCWNWSYKTIEEHMELIAQCGYTAIQTSPAQQPKDYNYQGHVCSEVGYPGVSGKGNWWKMYQPVTFDVCDNGHTWLGTKAELTSMCKTAEKYGIKVIVDIVANHMGNISGWQNSMSDISPQVGEYWDPNMMTDESFWHINDLQIWMSDGREHFTQGTMGMPDLNTANKTVQKYVYEYLNELIDCGVDGYRFDAAKHIETPDDGSFASDFWPTVLGEARSHYKSVTGGDLFVYGEILNTVGDNFSIDSYTKYMSVTDNSAGHHLLESVRNGQASTPEMHYAANKSVIWAESHDTYMNESSRYASDKSIVRSWAMAANKKDASSLFFTRPYYSKDTLLNGNDGQERGNLPNDLAPAMMGDCETYVWASKEVAAINHFRNRMAGSADEMGADGNIAYVKRGNGIILVNFGGAGEVSTGAHGLADGSYTDEVSGNTFKVSGGTISGNITSEYGVAVIYQNTMPNPSDAYPVKIRSSIADGSNFYLDTLGLTLTADFAENATYETSAGEKGTFKDSIRVNVGEGLSAGDKLTVKVTGTNSRDTYEKTFTYYKQDLDIDQCIFFKNSFNWTKVNAYIYHEEGKETTETNTGWSGEPMFEYEEAEDGSMIYAVMVEDIDKYNKVNFNNNVAELQSSIGSYGQMFDAKTGSWTKFMEPGTGKAKISSSLDSTTIHGAREVTFSVSNADSALYSVDGGKETSFTDKVTITIGENLEEGASQIVKVVATKGDKTTEKTYTYTMGENKPELSVSPNDGDTFKDTLEVTLTAENIEEATYQVGEEAAVSFSGTKTITVGKNMQDGDVVKIKVYGKSSNGKEDIVTAAFTKEEEDNNTGTCIYFKNTKGWDSVNAYVWKDETTSHAKWPGKAMELYDKENHIYSLDLGTEITYKNVIFNTNGGSQTADLTLPGLGQLYDPDTGKWSQYGEQGLKISSSLTSRNIKGETEVTFQTRAAKSAEVSVNGETAEKFTDSIKLTVGKDLKPGEEDIVKVTASDGTDKITRTFIYTMEGMAASEEKPKLTGITVKDTDVLYDGNDHAVLLETPEETTVHYGTSQGSYTLDKAPVYKEPGKYIVYFKVSKNGYQDYTGKGTVTVNGVQVKSSSESKNFVTFEESVAYANGLNEKSTITLYADATVQNNVILDNRITINNKENVTLTIPAGVTLENGTLAGNVENDGKLLNVTLSDTAKVSGDGIEEKTDVISTPSVDPTSNPDQTMKPDKTAEPGKTDEPNTSNKPNYTNNPMGTDKPDRETTAPNVTETPNVTQAPSGDEDLNNTATPIPTETVKPLQPTPVTNKVVIDKVTFNPGVTQVAKKTVKINMRAKGGSGKYLYSLEISNSQGAIVAGINESKNNTYNWTPKAAGTYEIYVDIKDTQTGITSKGKIYKYVVVKKKLTITQVKISKKKIVNKKKVDFTVTATGGKTKYKYALTIKNAKGKVVKKVNYQSKKKLNWKPSKTGKYTIYVSVKDATNTVKTKKKIIKVVKK